MTKENFIKDIDRIHRPATLTQAIYQVDDSTSGVLIASVSVRDDLYVVKDTHGNFLTPDFRWAAPYEGSLKYVTGGGWYFGDEESVPCESAYSSFEIACQRANYYLDLKRIALQKTPEDLLQNVTPLLDVYYMKKGSEDTQENLLSCLSEYRVLADLIGGILTEFQSLPGSNGCFVRGKNNEGDQYNKTIVLNFGNSKGWDRRTFAHGSNDFIVRIIPQAYTRETLLSPVKQHQQDADYIQCACAVQAIVHRHWTKHQALIAFAQAAGLFTSSLEVNSYTADMKPVRPIDFEPSKNRDYLVGL